MLPQPNNYGLISLSGDYFSLFGTELPNGSASKLATMGQFISSVRTVKWTGDNLVYANTATAYPTSGTITSYMVTYADNSVEFAIKNISYAVTGTFTANGLVLTNDYWLGSSKNDVFPLTSGNDYINGEAGLDSIKSSIASTNYIISFNTSNNLTLQNKSNKYTYTTDSIERLIFTNKSIAFDINGNAGTIAKILGAVFGKSSVTNPTYVGIGLGLLDEGKKISEVMDLALSTALGKSYSTDSMIKLLYTNIVGESPSTFEVQLYSNLVSNNLVSSLDLAWQASDTSKNSSNVDLVGLMTTGLDYIPA